MRGSRKRHLEERKAKKRWRDRERGEERTRKRQSYITVLTGEAKQKASQARKLYALTGHKCILQIHFPKTFPNEVPIRIHV